jgi:hypothetical protein
MRPLQPMRATRTAMPPELAEPRGDQKMFKFRLAPALVLVFCVFFSQPALAFFDPPYVTPANPSEGQTVSLNIRSGECDAIFGTPGYPQISQQGNVVTMVLYGARETDPILCYYGTGTSVFPVGNYPAESYILNVNLRYQGFNGLPLVDSLGSVPFTVSSAAATTLAAPTINGWGLGILLLALAAVALYALGIRFRVLPIVFVALLLPGMGRAAQFQPWSASRGLHTT